LQKEGAGCSLRGKKRHLRFSRGGARVKEKEKKKKGKAIFLREKKRKSINKSNRDNK